MNYRTISLLFNTGVAALTIVSCLLSSCSAKLTPNEQQQEALKSIVAGCECFYIDNGRFPATLDELLAPIPYITTWDEDFVYRKVDDTFLLSWTTQAGEKKEYQHPEGCAIDYSLHPGQKEFRKSLQEDSVVVKERRELEIAGQTMIFFNGTVHHTIREGGNVVWISDEFGNVIQESDRRSGVTKRYDLKKGEIWSIKG